MTQMRPMMSVSLGVLLVLCLIGGVGCSKEGAELRAREAAEKMKESLPDVDGKALAQKLAPEEVRHAQQALTTLKEYQGEINGQLDSITVNALQAFQRSQGLRDDGILNDVTKRRLQEAASKAGGQGG